MTKGDLEGEISYAEVGVDRSAREKGRNATIDRLRRHWQYSPSPPLELPFGSVFPIDSRRTEFFDLEIEGVGTKTLLAEILPEGYSSIGVDAVAMAVNDVIRSGAKPILLADAIHQGRSLASIDQQILEGVISGAKMSGCIVASGETGEVAEILHEGQKDSFGPPFDLMVSCLGIVRKEGLIEGNLKEGDEIIGIESSGLHANGFTLARRVLLRRWGGVYDPQDVPDGFQQSIIKVMLEPTRIYANELLKSLEMYKIKAAVHITGDGFGKFKRLLNFQNNASLNLGAQFENIDFPPEIFTLIETSARDQGKPISKKEMFSTFNMGIGFAVVVDPDDSEGVIDLFNKYHPAKRIGRITRAGKTVIIGPKSWDRPVIL